MDRDTIIRLAREAGLYTHVEWGGMFYVTSGFLENFPALAAAHERERICKQIAMLHDSLSLTGTANWGKT